MFDCVYQKKGKLKLFLQKSGQRTQQHNTPDDHIASSFIYNLRGDARKVVE